MNPILGVLFHWLGGFASGSFYVPYRRVRNWSWETYWLVGGVFSWIIAPWLFALIMTEDIFGVLQKQTLSTLCWTFLFGSMWGMGGLTFGLTMRYLGLSLGMGVALGYCAAFGTLLPPFAKSIWPDLPIDTLSLAQIAASTPGKITLFGILVCLIGIALGTLAGLTKEREMPEELKKKVIKEFNFTRGLVVATFSGIMSACFAFALTAANPIATTSQAAGTADLWVGLPKLVVVLLGGFTTNFIWCAILHIRNHSSYEYLASQLRVPTHDSNNETILETTLDAPSKEIARTVEISDEANDRSIPRVNNYFFSALAGSTWYMQFFFYTMGETQMGRYGFASWTLHMASIIIFSTLWGVILKEWHGASNKVILLISASTFLLILSTVIVGYGTYIAGLPAYAH